MTVSPKAARKVTERRAAIAARQLAYHRRRIRWMEERIEANTALLQTYLVEKGQEAAVLLGGYAVGLTDAGEIAVSEPRRSSGPGYEQLEITNFVEVEHG